MKRRRFYNVPQKSDNDCGAAVLASVSRHWGHRIPLSVIRELSKTSRHGVDLLNLKTAATELGFVAKAIACPPDLLGKLPLPCIAHVCGADGLGHFVVVYRHTTAGLTIADPASTLRVWTLEEFRARWSGNLLLLAPTERLAATVQPSPSLRSYARLLSLHKGVVLEAFLAAICSTALGMLSALFLQFLMDEIIGRGQLSLLHVISLGMLVVLVFQSLFGAFRTFLLAHLGQKLDAIIQSQTYRHLMRLPLPFFQSRQVGEIVARLTEASLISDLLANTVLALVLDGVLVVLSSVLLFVYHPGLAVVASLLLPVSAFIMWLFRRVISKTQREHLEAVSRLQGRHVGSLSAIQIIKAFGAEEGVCDTTEAELATVLRLRFRLGMFGGAMQNLVTFVSAVFVLAVLWYGGRACLAGSLSPGQLMSFYALIGLMMGPVRNLSSAQIKVEEASTAASRVGELMALGHEWKDEGGKMSLERAKGELELVDVTFSYDRRRPVLRKVSLRIPAGSTVALVGESGSGKTTLCRLLLRFYEPEEGRILLDGINIRGVHLASLRKQFGWVDQDSLLLNRSLADNIRLGHPAASNEEIIEAGRIACAEEFVNRFPDGYNTRIGELGGGLSGGERQRLCIARALVGTAPVLVLDEATSHLDSKSERAIQSALEAAGGTRTLILVAHRLSTVVNADMIVVMKGGEIAETGTHRELLEQRGLYAELWQRQTAGGAQRIPPKLTA